MPADFGRLPRAVEMTLFRVVQEALNNIHRCNGSRSFPLMFSEYFPADFSDSFSA
jgi:signal transduction histidine kinase